MSERLNLVTGACGFSGSHLVKHLLDNGQRVIATDLPAAFEDEKTRPSSSISISISPTKA